MYKTKRLLVLALICCWFILAAQGDFYKKYTMYDGLAQQQVTCLFQDSRGYMWIGTKGGMSKFDGEFFETFGTADGLVYPFVTDVEEDHEGNIWIATWYGMSRFDGKETTSFKLPIGNNNNIEIDGQNQIWVFHSLSSDEKRTQYLSLFENGELISADIKYKSFKGLGTERILFDKLNDRMVFSFGKDGLYSFKNGELKLLAKKGNAHYSILQKNSFSKEKIIITERIEEERRTYFSLENDSLSELPLKNKNASIVVFGERSTVHHLQSKQGFFKMGKWEISTIA